MREVSKQRNPFVKKVVTCKNHLSCDATIFMKVTMTLGRALTQKRGTKRRMPQESWANLSMPWCWSESWKQSKKRKERIKRSNTEKVEFFVNLYRILFSHNLHLFLSSSTDSWRWADMEVPRESFDLSSKDSRTCYPSRTTNQKLTND